MSKTYIEKQKFEKTDLNSWPDIKDRIYGKKGTKRRERLERGAENFIIRLLKNYHNEFTKNI